MSFIFLILKITNIEILRKKPQLLLFITHPLDRKKFHIRNSQQIIFSFLRSLTSVAMDIGLFKIALCNCFLYFLS